MRLLLDGRLAPMTHTVGFLEAPPADAVEAFVGWQRSIYEPQGVSVTRRDVPGGLEEALPALLPLTSVVRRRHLFVPTAGPWVAYFDNGHRGTDAVSAMSYLAERVGCRGLRVTLTPDTVEGEFAGARGEYGAVVWEVYGPHQTDFLNYVRAVSVVHDGAKWAFSQAGRPFDFEDVGRYNAPRVRDRFTPAHLSGYLRELGLSPFDEAFYAPDPAAPSVLVEKQGPAPATMKEFTPADLGAK